MIVIEGARDETSELMMMILIQAAIDEMRSIVSLNISRVPPSSIMFHNERECVRLSMNGSGR